MGKLKAIGSSLSRLKPTIGSLAPIERTVGAERQLFAPWRTWYKSARWRALRLLVFARDLYTCQWPGWASPADATDYDSTFLGEFLRRQVADFGVNCAMVGHSVGGTTIAQWLPGTANNTALRNLLTAVGGFEAAYWFLGGTDAGSSTSPATFAAGLTTVFNDFAAYNAVRGNAFEKYVSTMASRIGTAAGTVDSIQGIRKAAADWASAIGATYLEPHDISLVDDVHQDQPGSITLARHLHRATKGTFAGPSISAAARTGAVITLGTSAPVTLLGNVASRFQVYATGTTANPLSINSVAATGTTITITLAADPGNVALDVYWLRHPDPAGAAPAQNMIYDTFSDGITPTRQLRPTLSTPVAVAASGTGTPAPAPSAPFSDTFTDVADTALASHVANTGQAWTNPVGTLKVQSTGQLGTASAAVSNTGMSGYDPASTTSWIEADFINNQSGGTVNKNAAWLLGRMVDGTNFYQFGCQLAASTPGWFIGRTINGTFAAIGNVSAFTFVDNTTYHLRAELVGNGSGVSTLRLFVDGTQVLEVTDSNFPLSGEVGVRLSGGLTTTTSGMAIDNIKAGTL